MNTNIDSFIKKIVPILIVILLAYFLTVVVGFFLPKYGINYVQNDSLITQNNYTSLYSTQKTKVVEKKQTKKVVPNQTLSEFKLNAIYYFSDNSGWIILQKRNNETVILQQNEEINGYKLISLFKNHVVFEKNNKEYKLVLDDTELNLPFAEFQKSENYNQNAIDQINDSLISIDKKYLNTYLNNSQKVWNDISIKELRNNKMIIGFKIVNIKVGSDFEKLGLMNEDIIKKVNGKLLKSYADAFNVYNNMKNINYLTIEILRNNNTMELNYEIN